MASFVAPTIETVEVRLVFTVAVDVLGLMNPADLVIPSCEFSVALENEI